MGRRESKKLAGGLPSRELAEPNLGKRKIIDSKVPLGENMFVLPGGLKVFFVGGLMMMMMMMMIAMIEAQVGPNYIYIPIGVSLIWGKWSSFETKQVSPWSLKLDPGAWLRERTPRKPAPGPVTEIFAVEFQPRKPEKKNTF